MKFTPKGRQQWRRWLEENHAGKTEVWLVFFKKHTGKPSLSYNDAVEEALCFGWIDGIKRSIDDERYMHRFTPRKAGSKWSKSNRERAGRLLDKGLMSAAGMRSIERAKRDGSWARLAGQQTDVPMPGEFAARLKRNRKAASFFASLAPSYQRQYIGWIATARRSETRKSRVDEAIRLLERGEKLGMR